MKIENKRAEITRLIEAIKKHSDHLNEMETIPVLEIGVILSKINKLHEEAAVLKYLCEEQQGKRVQLQSSDLIVTNFSDEDVEKNQANKNTEPEVEQGKSVEEAMLSAKEKTEEDALDQMFEATIEEEEEKSITQVSATDEEEEVKSDEISETKTEKDEAAEKSSQLDEALLNQLLEEAKGEEEEKSISTLDKLDKEKNISSKQDINEAFAGEDSSISGHLQKQPVADLMSAIGLNERYLYANDLFEGDMQEFKDAIKMLNEFDRGEDAKAFFESGLRSNYKWEDDNALAQALFNLVERRYL
jgi:hypothetical protein